MFSMLEPPAGTRGRSAASLVCGVLIQVLAVSFAILVGLMYPQELAVTRHTFLAWLPPTEPTKPPEVRHLPKPPHVVIPVVKTPHALVLPPPPVVEPKMPKSPPPVTAVMVPVPPPPVPAPTFKQPTPAPKPKEQIVVQTGLFGGAQEKVTTKLPPSKVQTGGFGDPQGFKGQAKGDSLGNVPKLGSFDLPDGPGYGNGTGGKHGVPGIVASAGFGSAVGAPGGAGSGGGGGSVAVGGFEKTRQAASAQVNKPVDLPPADFQPVEILFKPTPVYTDEARRLGIQGDVVLSVVFLANGALKLNGVVRSLGHGLDQAAEEAAKQIRFKPAQRAGQPADFPATLHIEFRLAGQST